MKKLKEMKVKLFILTRCRADLNLCRGKEKLNGGAVESDIVSSSAINYYRQIVELMDGVFTADKVITIKEYDFK